MLAERQVVVPLWWLNLRFKKKKKNLGRHNEGQGILIIQHKSSEYEHTTQRTKLLLLVWCWNLEKMIEFLGSRFN
jgi:hypothetical protein